MGERLLRINSECNQNCLFCNIKNKEESYLSDEAVRKEIKKAGANEDIIMFTGGEPTLNKHLLEYIKLAKDSRVSVIGIQTNAMMFSYPEYTEKITKAGLNYAFIPFHSHDKKIFEEITRVPGSYEKAIKGIINIAKKGVNITLNIVTNSRNYKTLPETISFIKREFGPIIFSRNSKEDSISFSFVQPHGLAWGNTKIVPKLSEVKPYLKEAMEICDKQGIIFNNPLCGVPLCFVEGYEENSLEYQMTSMNTSKEALNAIFKDKIKPVSCNKCMMNDRCFGVWKAYAEIYGIDELIPIAKEKCREKISDSVLKGVILPGSKNNEATIELVGEHNDKYKLSSDRPFFVYLHQNEITRRREEKILKLLEKAGIPAPIFIKGGMLEDNLFYNAVSEIKMSKLNKFKPIDVKKAAREIYEQIEKMNSIVINDAHLVHGDLHPDNILYNGKEAGFLDLTCARFGRIESEFALVYILSKVLEKENDPLHEVYREMWETYKKRGKMDRDLLLKSFESQSSIRTFREIKDKDFFRIIKKELEAELN